MEFYFLVHFIVSNKPILFLFYRLPLFFSYYYYCCETDWRIKWKCRCRNLIFGNVSSTEYPSLHIAILVSAYLVCALIYENKKRCRSATKNIMQFWIVCRWSMRGRCIQCSMRWLHSEVTNIRRPNINETNKSRPFITRNRLGSQLATRNSQSSIFFSVRIKYSRYLCSNLIYVQFEMHFIT